MKILDREDESAIGLICVGITMVVLAAMLGQICGNIAPAGPGPGKPGVAQESTSPRQVPEVDKAHSE